MGRLIDADELRESVCKLGFDYDERRKIHSIINDSPTVDAKPTVHAHWNEENKVADGLSPRHRKIHYTMNFCSNCHISNGRRKTNFCPYCGAEMDAKEGDS